MMVAIKVVFGIVRYMAFIFLLFINPVVEWVLSIVAGISLLCWLFCLIAWKDPTMHHMIWAMFGTGMLATGLLFGFNILISVLAPDDYIVISEI